MDSVSAFRLGFVGKGLGTSVRVSVPVCRVFSSRGKSSNILKNIFRFFEVEIINLNLSINLPLTRKTCGSRKLLNVF